LERVSWQFSNVTDVERRAFSSFSKTLCYEGQEINEDPMSRLTKVEVQGRHYYIKAYKKRGRNLRQFLGRSRVRAEWENLQLIARMNIPTLELVAFGEEKKLLGGRRGLLVTRDLPGAIDLKAMAELKASVFQQANWVNGVIDKLSSYVRIMHDYKFVHGDLKWRNILVDSSDSTEVYIFDCPQGRRLPGVLLIPLLSRAKIKDLACLDKVAKHKLRRTQRMRFYLSYSGLEKLNRKHKVRIRRILSFFTGRE
jgi:tRNA A-37 threonylcarbamoyl transferase component Bud32